MATDTRRGVSLTPKPRPDRVRLAEAIAATEQQVAATLAARARTRPQDADRLMALSRKAAEAAARERRDAEAYLRQSWNLMSDTERIARQLEMIAHSTVGTRAACMAAGQS